ncbi:MAG: hypothetical protein ACYTG6_05545 [Planctomycetota bacterium]|jgi:hypothetical protein
MDYRRKVREALRVRCIHLKTKAAFLGLPDPGDRENDLDTAVWWCQQSCEALGPDRSAATPDTCEKPGRTCYEPPVRPA